MLNVQLLMDTMQLAIKCKRHVWLAAEDDYDEFQSKLFHLHETLIQYFLRLYCILYIYMHSLYSVQCTVYTI